MNRKSKIENRKFKIAFIGGGNMAEAVMRGIIKAGLYQKRDVIVSDVDESRLQYCRSALGVRTCADNLEAVRSAKTAVLAVKPQQAPQVLAELRKKLPKDVLLISIVTGFTTKRIAQLLGQAVRVMRVVPNTPALVGLSASAYCRGKGTTAQDKKLIENILRSVGICIALDERAMNAVTALSGSGPAYVFYLVEALLEAGKKIGLPENEARKLVVATVLGAARLLQETGLPAGELRRRVTSRKGTTEAAIKILDRRGVGKSIEAAALAAFKRAKELFAK